MARNTSIDFLRGLSSIAILLIHILAWKDNSVQTLYTGLPFLFNLRLSLQFFVVTILFCSGFALFISNKNMELTKKSILAFYKKRLSNLLFPWWTFLIFFFSIHILIKLVTGLELIDFSLNYVFSSFIMIGGIGFGWLVILMMLLMLLFPFFIYIYRNHRKRFIFPIFLSIYFGSYLLFLFNPINIFEFTWTSSIHYILPIIYFMVCFISGWGLVYFIGFVYANMRDKRVMIKKELRSLFGFVLLFFITKFIYSTLGFEMNYELNKYPPSPLFLSFGLMLTFLLLTIYYAYRSWIHRHVEKGFYILSSNSYWIFMWSALTISIISSFDFSGVTNTYLKLSVELVLNSVFIFGLIFLQKKLDKRYGKYSKIKEK